jgi:hypothetical protein
MRRVDETAESGNQMRLSSDESAEVVSTDELVAKIATTVEVATIIFSFFNYSDIMRLRRVCKTWRDAAKKTLVPLSKFEVTSVRKYNAMRVMSTVLPNVQQLSIHSLGEGHKYSDGEDPNEALAAFHADETAHHIGIISNFSKLRILKIWEAPLNGRYPVLFDFQLLQNLTIRYCRVLKWDLEMLEGLPLLKELDCCGTLKLEGNLMDLRVLKDTLEKVEIYGCSLVEGNLMDLADFPHLKELDLRETAVTGDIRDIRGNDFPALERLSLPEGVHGGLGYQIQHISDVSSLLHMIHLLLQRTPDLFGGSDLLSSPDLFGGSDLLSRAFGWRLSRDSPDWYADESGNPEPPFRIQFVQAGSRRGWSWCTWWGSHSCEIHWFDPEPSCDSSNYGAYIEELQHFEGNITFYRGYHQPPTEAEYRRLCEGLRE